MEKKDVDAISGALKLIHEKINEAVEKSKPIPKVVHIDCGHPGGPAFIQSPKCDYGPVFRQTGIYVELVTTATNSDIFDEAIPITVGGKQKWAKFFDVYGNNITHLMKSAGTEG